MPPFTTKAQGGQCYNGHMDENPYETSQVEPRIRRGPAKKRRWWPVVAVLSVLALAAVLIFTAWTVQNTLEAVYDSYAVKTTADLIIEHMKENEGRWPSDWDDLRHIAQTKHMHSGAFPEVADRVNVDWDADPSELRKAEPRPDGPPFRVIWLKSSRDVHWEGMEPNQLILDYLKQSDSAD